MSLLNFLSSVSMTPENSEKGLVWFPAMKRMFASCKSTENPGDCVESFFEDGKKLYERTDFISTQLYREYITYAMQFMGLWKFMVENYPEEVFAAVNMNVSASQSASPSQRILFSLNLSVTITMGKY